MPVVPCQYPGCNVTVTNDSEALALEMFKSHVLSHSQPASTTQSQKLPPIPRPEIKQDVSEEDWTSFVTEWGNFKRCTGIKDGQVTDQLYQCCEKSLAKLLVREQPDVVSHGETELLAAMKRLAVIKVAKSVRRTNVLAQKQSHGETFREFYANVKAAAATCHFQVKCRHDCCADKALVDYTSNVVKDVLVGGVADPEIRKEVHSWMELDQKDDKAVVEFVESKVMAQSAWNGTQPAGAAALSSYKKSSKGSSEGDALEQSLKSKLALNGKCAKCQADISLYRRFPSGKLNRTAFKTCRRCFKEEKEQSESSSNAVADDDVTTSAVESFFIGAVSLGDGMVVDEVSSEDSSSDEAPRHVGTWGSYLAGVMSLMVMFVAWGCSKGLGYRTGAMALMVALAMLSAFMLVMASGLGPRNQGNFGGSWGVTTLAAAEGVGRDHVDPSVNAVNLDHQIFTKEGWRRATALAHPSLRLRVATRQEDYGKFGLSFPPIQPKHIDVVVDSGAQSCLWSRASFLRCGFTQEDLIPVRHLMRAANTAPITVDGAILLRLSGETSSGERVEAAVMAYISPDTDNFYLSREAMVQLGIIERDFPRLGAAGDTHRLNAVEDERKGTGLRAECGCLKREKPPSRLSHLPFPCILENVGKMRDWLLERYASSTFNKCPHQDLPEMDGPPIEIHVDPDAVPVKLRKPAPVPLHWQEQVLSELRRDVALGVIERVPIGEATTWCFRMVITRKDDGSPRRTVDLSPLNAHCQREMHSSKSPFNLARSVPGKSFKTVFDAWNGYHSVPIRVEDRHLTTFITPWGLFRYRRAPQGFLSSGDGYNRRFDDLTEHIERMERCVDDALLHDADLEAHWWRVIDFIEMCGRSGIVLNSDGAKFQFAQPTVDFAGFRITDDSVEPLPKYLDAIRGFPTPKSTRDIRSWFGLVNQVAHYAQLRDMMSPFRKFLSPKKKFEWTEELNDIFEESKLRIVEAIREGVKIYDVNRHTCLRTDWSKRGVGYFLAQKHCDCSGSYGCCPDGYKITLAGSRFLSSAEKNYAPVEGEALAVAWALEQTRFFTMGCNDLKVIVDHKPLTKLLGNRRLDEITNPRLFRLKRRTLMWRFKVEYQRGASNPFADAISRRPNRYAELASTSLMSKYDAEEAGYVGGIASEAEDLFAVTWDMVRDASARDEAICMLANRIKGDFPKEKSGLPDMIKDFWKVREDLRCSDGVVTYNDRIVVPGSLRKQIVRNLHSAHQGLSSMYSRAQTIVYWPRLMEDLEKARNECRSCHKNAPSQPKLPPTAPKTPTTPFQMIYADYFQLKGKHYLVVGDRLSGWTEVVQVRKSVASCGSKGLCEALRMVMVRFGVPEEISDDGGPEFVSTETGDFFKRWGIKQRLSSAYFPQSNGRAEVAVKATKRLLEDNMSENGSLNTDEVVRALLQQRNTPDRDCKLSPAQVLFGRCLRDSMPQLSRTGPIFQNDRIHDQWHQAWAAKEEAIRSRLFQSCEKLEASSRELPPLREGDQVIIQNQDKSSGRPNKWDRQGTVIAVKDYDQYLVRVHGSGRLTIRNRRFLRKFSLRPQHLDESPKGFTQGNESQQDVPIAAQGPSEPVARPASAHDPDVLAADVPAPEVPAPNLGQPPGYSPSVPSPVRMAGGGSPDNTTLESAATPQPQSQAEQDRPRRKAGRPPKRRHFNFSSQRTDPQPQSGLEPENPEHGAHEGEMNTTRPIRTRKQREVYDASTGEYKMPAI